MWRCSGSWGRGGGTSSGGDRRPLRTAWAECAPRQVVDDREVGGVGREESHAVDVGGGGDREVDRSAARPSAALGDRGREASPFPGNASVTGRGSDVASIMPSRCARRPCSSGSAATSVPKCSLASDAALIPPSRSPGWSGADQDRGVEQDAATRRGRRARRGAARGLRPDLGERGSRRRFSARDR